MDKIDNNFYVREKKFVENQKNHIEAYKNYLIKENDKYLKKNYRDKDLVIKNVVNRLYQDGLEKVLIRNNTKQNLFSKHYYNRTESENKEDYQGNETIYTNQSLLN